MSQYFPKPFLNYATKTDLKNVTHIDTSNFVLKTNLASLKTEVDKLDIDKLAPVLVDLSKLSDVVKVNNIDTNDFKLKTNYNADKTKLENKIPITDFVKKVKLTELENKIPDISNLAIKTALTTVENKTLDVSNLVEKTDYNTKITEIENKLNNHNSDKYITTPEFNTFNC